MMVALPPEMELIDELQRSRAETDALFNMVQAHAMYDRPIAERHRLIFYVGHVEAFEWNLLGKTVFDSRSFEPSFDALFAFGIDPTGTDLPRDRATDWPDMPAVRAYRQQVRVRVDALLSRQIARDDCNRALHIAIEHRLMHAETLVYLLRQMPLSVLRPPAEAVVCESAPVPRKSVMVPAGTVSLGQHRTQSFGWDNEFEANAAHVDACAIDVHPVTHGEYLRFVEAGGYRDAALWTPADWAWRQKQRLDWPRSWRRTDAGWRVRAPFVERPLPHAWPVYVSQAEAAAYARFVGRTLPTEAQWMRAAYGTPQGHERLFPWGDGPPAASDGNFASQRFCPLPVDYYRERGSAFGVQDLLGNGWEWTRTHFTAYPGFRVDPLYPNYSEPFFDAKHFVLKGAGPRTPRRFLRRSFRNWFQPHYPYIDATFRCVEN